MDDLTAELRLRGLEPPYGAVKQELATRFAGMDEAMTPAAGDFPFFAPSPAVRGTDVTEYFAGVARITPP